MNALSAWQTRIADRTSVSSTVCRSKVERLITLSNIGGGGLLLQGFAQIFRSLSQFVEQPRVLDGDDGLVCKTRDQLDLLVGERAYLGAIDGDPSDDLTLLEHR